MINLLSQDQWKEWYFDLPVKCARWGCREAQCEF